MAEADTTPPPPSDSNQGGGLLDPAVLQVMQQLMPQPVQVDQTPVKQSWLSRLGQAIGGGVPAGVPLSPQQKEDAGLHALRGFGVGLMAASHYVPGQTIWSNLAQGFQGAQQGELGTAQQAASWLGAQQDYQEKLAQTKLAALKEAIPLLQQQRMLHQGNPLLGNQPGSGSGGGGGPAAPNTSIAVAAAGGPGTYEGSIAGHEGTAQNPNSTALGGGQFLEGTWNAFAQANPELFKGMSPQQILAARLDPGLTAKATTWLAQQNAQALEKQGVTATGQSLGIAHYLGAGGAGPVMKAPDSDPVSKYVSAAAVKANPELGTMTVGDMKKRYAGMPNPAFLGGPTAVAGGPPAAPPAATPPAPGKPPAAPPGPAVGGGSQVSIGSVLQPPAAASAGNVVPGLDAAQATEIAKHTGQDVPFGDPRARMVAHPNGQIGSLGGGAIPGKAASAADVIQQGIQTAQAQPAPPGTVLTAGPGAGTPPGAPSIGSTPGVTTALAPPQPPAAPAVTTQPPAAPPAPQLATKADQPPGPASSYEQWKLQHPTIALTPEERAAATVTVPNLEALEAAKRSAAQAYGNALTAQDQTKASQAYTTASEALIKAQQEAAKATAEQQSKALQAKEDLNRQLYESEQQRNAENARAAAQLAQQAAEADKQREAAKDLERIKGGQTWHQELEKQAAEYAQTNTIKPMNEAALKSHQMNMSLGSMVPLLQDLPPSGGALGTVLDAHPDLAPLFNSAGILSDRQADSVKLINGLVANVQSQMKPQGLGALREYEWDAFKAQLPGMLGTKEGNMRALVTLMNFNDRIQKENGWLNNYFNRKVPDEYGQPGQTRTAHNLETDGAESYQERMDRELGPLVPTYQGPMNDKAVHDWVQTLPPGKPYFAPKATRDPNNPNQALRDRNGNVVTHTEWNYRPWQQ